MKILFSKLEEDIEAKAYIKKYGRLYGWYLANKLNLPTQKECYLITNMQDIKSCYQDVSGVDMLYCRGDAPWGEGNNLLRSKDLLPEELEDFFKACNERCPNSIVLVYRHPSVWITNKYLPRYMTTGAAQVLFRKDKRVTIELVGSGFDCGDISRGKTVHFRLEVDKNTMLFDFPKIVKESKLLGDFYEITQNDYGVSRKNRVKEMTECYGKDFQEEISSDIPEQRDDFYKLAQIISETCIYPVLDSNIIWNDYVLMINLYNNQPYIYEVWQQKRSLTI